MKRTNDSLLEKIWNLLNANTVQLSGISTHVAVLNKEMGDVKTDIKEMKDSYVMRSEFTPIQRIVFGFVGLILVATVTAIIRLVIK